jgi:hypothetical protein
MNGMSLSELALAFGTTFFTTALLVRARWAFIFVRFVTFLALALVLDFSALRAMFEILSVWTRAVARPMHNGTALLLVRQ